MPPDRADLLRRDRNPTDTERVVFIATEGGRTEPDYFNGLDERGLFPRNRVRHVVLPTRDGRSRPEQVLNRLEEERAKIPNWEARDEFWLVIDVDYWGAENLDAIAAACARRGIALAVSNPCFELWLALHVADASDLPPGDCQSLKPDLRQRGVLKGRNFTLVLESLSDDSVGRATFQAKALDTNADEVWPHARGTRVYRLVESMRSA